jgi:NDP-sugar pyrophosphorylase family protein
MPVDDFQLFVSSASAFAENAMVLGVTGHVDDENPLWVTLDPSDRRIRQIGGREGTHVTAGLYRLSAQKPSDSATDFARLRDYLGWLVADNQPVYGVILPCVFDIDRARDIAAAEEAALRYQRETSEL